MFKVVKRTIIRMKGQQALYGAKTLDNRIEDIIIENEITLDNI